MNPPYGAVIGKWMRKAWDSAQESATVVCLVPARTDTEWWHRFAMRGEVRLLKGRLKFGDYMNSAPFPSALVVFRPAGYVLRGDFTGPGGRPRF
jgi:site-specific DNA-methyltransferase (adenine-specific)